MIVWTYSFLKRIRLLLTGFLIVAIFIVFFPCFLEGGSAELEYAHPSWTWHPELVSLLKNLRNTWAISQPGLPKGLAFPEPDTFKIIQGEENLIRITGKKHVEIKDLLYAVSWKAPRHRNLTSLIVISNCDEVVLDNVHVLQLNKDSKAAHTVIFEDCGRVVVKNSSFRGACSYHLRIEGAREVIIDSVEISGFEYEPDQMRCGGGIFINNGDDKPGKYHMTRGQYTPNPNNLTHFAIINSWFHDSDEDKQRENIDGVLIHSGAHGLISNCLFQNWQGGDSALDVSHRRLDKGYDRKLIRVERNIFSKCRIVKSVGRSHASCSIIWCNNLYNDTVLADYHQGYEVLHAFEDIVFTKPSPRLMALWGLRDGQLRIERCLFVLPSVRAFIHQGDAGTPSDYTWLSSDYNVFYLGNPIYWVLGQGVTIEESTGWQTAGNDIHSSIISLSPELRKDVMATGHYLHLDRNIPTVLDGSHSIPTDYAGKQRREELHTGAFLPEN